ncbi:MAG: ABA4-like family protein [Myxococcota bacterium]
MMDTLFSASSLLVMPQWLMMVFAPKWRVTMTVMRSPLVVLPAALLYAALVIPMMVEALPVLAQPKLQTIASMLGTPAGATVGWIHFLAFDLFVGRWIYLDAHEHGRSPWLVSPILALTLMFGPLGLAIYVGLRMLRGNTPAPSR